MNKDDIKAVLRTKGSSLAKIAGEMRVGRSAMSKVLAGERSERIERAIATALDQPVEDVFTDRTYEKKAA